MRKTTEEFIEKSRLKHGDKYDYSKVNYVNESTHVLIICPIHGEFKQAPKNHYKGDCKKCAFNKKKENHTSIIPSKRKTKKEFEEQANLIHNNLYDYSKVEYISNKKNIEIGCIKHGSFKQTPKNHLHGQGCPKCAKEMNSYRRSHYIKISEESTLYLVRMYNEDEEFLKIGKSIYGAKRRFQYVPTPYKVEVLKEYKAEIGLVYDLEIELHRRYKGFKHQPNIKFPGYTECYTMLLPIEEIKYE